eukprot:gene11926-2174_t
MPDGSTAQNDGVEPVHTTWCGPLEARERQSLEQELLYKFPGLHQLSFFFPVDQTAIGTLRPMAWAPVAGWPTGCEVRATGFVPWIVVLAVVTAAGLFLWSADHEVDQLRARARFIADVRVMPRMDKSNTGLVMMAVGSARTFREGSHCIASLLKLGDYRAPVVVQEFWMHMALLPHATCLKRFDLAKYNLTPQVWQDKNQSMWALRNLRLDMIAASPFFYSMHLDTDTFLKGVFQMLSQYDFISPMAPRQRMVAPELTPDMYRTMSDNGRFPGEYFDRQRNIPTHWHELNAGIFWYRKTAQTMALFRSWQAELNARGEGWRWGDQMHLRKAMWEALPKGIKLWVLQDEYNVRGNPSCSHPLGPGFGLSVPTRDPNFHVLKKWPVILHQHLCESTDCKDPSRHSPNPST